jgi:putative ATPase
VHLATAPKSNRAAVAIWQAREDVTGGSAGEVPPHLRGTGYRSAAKLGHGVGYHYPHDDPRGWVEQEYRPPAAAGRTYYTPSPHGFEQEIADRMARLRSDGNNTDNDRAAAEDRDDRADTDNRAGDN